MMLLLPLLLMLPKLAIDRPTLVLLPGFGNNAEDYKNLTTIMSERGYKSITLPLQRTDWFKVFLRGALDPDFWLGQAPATNAAFGWYLDLVEDAVDKLDGEPCVLVGHSAGGWLARAALPVLRSRAKVKAVVTLGAPHKTPPDFMDMTRGAVTITNKLFPGAYYSQIQYISVAGNPIRGVKQERKSPFESTTVAGFAYNSYQQLCGDGGVEGDGVVPVISAHLENATQINIGSFGGYHSVNEPNRWYGSDAGINEWLPVLEAKIQSGTNQGLFGIDLSKWT